MLHYKDSIANKELAFEFTAKTDSLLRSLAGLKEGTGILGEEKLREKLSDVYGSVVSYPGRPAESQLQRIAGLEAELQQAYKDKDNIFTKYLAKLNQEFQNAGLKKIELYSKEQFALDKETK